MPATKLDNFTSDATRGLARLGNYGAFKQSNLGKTGGTVRSAAGLATGSANSSSASQAGGSAFGSIASGSNTSSVLVVAGSAAIIPDPNSPGVIQATSAPWSGLTGDLTTTQVIPFDGGTVGTPDTGLSRIAAGSLVIGNGATGDFSGSLKLTGLTLVGPLTDSTGAVGTSGQVLSSTVTGTKWVTGGGGPSTPSCVIKSASYTLQSTDGAVIFNVGCVATLPSGMTSGQTFRIKFTGTGALTIVATGCLIDGQPYQTFNVQYQAADFVFDGTNWNIF